jgi:hypothetical protein
MTITYRYRGLYILYIGLLEQDFFGSCAEGLHLGLLNIFAFFQLLYPLVDVESLLFT